MCNIYYCFLCRICASESMLQPSYLTKRVVFVVIVASIGILPLVRPFNLCYYTNQLLIFDTTPYKQPLESGDLQSKTHLPNNSPKDKDQPTLPPIHPIAVPRPPTQTASSPSPTQRSRQWSKAKRLNKKL